MSDCVVSTAIPPFPPKYSFDVGRFLYGKQRFLTRLLTSISAISMLTIGLGAAHASVLFDNGGPATQGGDSISNYMTANSFAVTTSEVLTGANIYIDDSSRTFAKFNGMINYAIYSDVSGSPGALLTSGAVTGLSGTSTGVITNIGPSFEVSFNFNSTFSAAAATTYFFDIQTANEYWDVSANPLSTSGSYQSTNGGASWFLASYPEHAFQLLGASSANPVPEPLSVALFGVAIVGLAVVRSGRQA